MAGGSGEQMGQANYAFSYDNNRIASPPPSYTAEAPSGHSHQPQQGTSQTTEEIDSSNENEPSSTQITESDPDITGHVSNSSAVTTIAEVSSPPTRSSARSTLVGSHDGRSPQTSGAKSLTDVSS